MASANGMSYLAEIRLLESVNSAADRQSDIVCTKCSFEGRVSYMQQYGFDSKGKPNLYCPWHRAWAPQPTVFAMPDLPPRFS